MPLSLPILTIPLSGPNDPSDPNVPSDPSDLNIPSDPSDPIPPIQAMSYVPTNFTDSSDLSNPSANFEDHH